MNPEIYIFEILYLKNSCELSDLTRDSDIGLKEHVLILYETYNFLLNSLKMLREIDIVHYDLHAHNILYSKTTGIPYIIDFGLSIPYAELKKLKISNYTNYFYTYASSAADWSLDIQTINYLLNKKEVDEKLLNEDIKYLVDNYVKHNKILYLCTDEFRNNYTNACTDYLMQYEQQSIENVVYKLLDTRKTWDLYTLSYNYLKYIYKIFSKRDGKYVKNSILIEICQILLSNINPDAKKRLSIEETQKRWKDILFGGSDETDSDHSKLLDEYLAFTNYLDSDSD
jgi:serine/threonine protein kinase